MNKQDNSYTGEAASESVAKFTTFGGVFTPSILTVLGVIMFMRAGFVIGQAGILNALIILAIAKSITLLTSFSISAIATNIEVKGGGAYYLISRTLGPEFGGTIGLTLFFAQALSVPFYIIGFSEALVATVSKYFPAFSSYYDYVTFSTAAVLFLIVFKGADWAIKVQYIVMAILALSIITFLGGALLKFDRALFLQNWVSAYTEPSINFWVVFAIYFPAATGIMAGVNMSGNLKNPTKAIPLGTFAAVIVGFIIYASQILICGGSIPRNDLVADPYVSLLNVAAFGLWIFVTLGVFAATLSSAIGSFLGAPRILQSLAQDNILRPAKPFAKLSSGGEPRRALWLTFAITLGTLYYAKGGGGDALNAVAAIVTMFFLWTYGITNLAAFVESFGQNPSFRPRFKLFHWMLAFLGAIGCIGTAFLIDPLAALGAIVIITGLFFYVRKFVLKTSFGDARRGFLYSLVRTNLFRLQEAPMHAKNWRPTMVVFTGNPDSRLTLARYADWLGGGRGIVILVALIVGKLAVNVEQRKHMIKILNEFIIKNKIQAFPQVLVTPQLELGMDQILQSTSLGPLTPNLVILGWSADPSRAEYFIHHLHTARMLEMSLILLFDNGLPEPDRKVKKRIDIWWRGKENGSLMAILAYLISLDSEWANVSIRFLRVVREDESHDEAYTELKVLIDASRMSALINIIDSEKPFQELLHAYSSDATVVFLGFQIPQVEKAAEFQSLFSSLLKGLPTTLLVNSNGEADLLA